MRSDAIRVRTRKAWQAVILSLLLPGLGHLYAGQPRQAGARWALGLGIGLLSFALILWLPLGGLSLLLAIVGGLAFYVWVATDAAHTARNAPRDFALRPYNNWLLYAVLVVAASFLPDVPKAFVQAYRIPSGAMEPTLQIGDFLFARRLKERAQALPRGTIVIFESVGAPGVMTVKRVAGLPGDTLAMRGGRLLLNGSPVPEPYLLESGAGQDRQDETMRQWQLRYYVGSDGAAYNPSLANWGPLVVPADSLFVLGDNRYNSYDSRYYGWVGRDRVRATPLLIYFSYAKNGPLPLPFLTAVRRERIGTWFR